ncbi:MAG: hypothetical protein ACI8RZ_003337 [Myxococcota bacterium]|jgi:hypothetical protein
MNLKTIGIPFLGAFFALVVGSFILPTGLNIERAVLVEAEPAVLYASISDLSKWNDWEPWSTGTTSEQTTGVGAARGWPGGGELILSELKEDEVHYQVHNLPVPASGFLALQAVEGGTAVVWVHQSFTGYGPISRIAGWAARGGLALEIDEGLARLKASAERTTAPSRNPPPSGG